MSERRHPGIDAMALEQARNTSYSGPIRDFVPVLFWASREKYRPGLDRLGVTDCESLFAPELLPAGGCRNLCPFWWPGDDAPQMMVRREA